MANLPLGAHVITASITDSNGKTASVARNVTVVAPPVFDYCSVSGATKAMWIETVNVAGVTNTSGSQGGYADFGGLGPIYLDRGANAIEAVPGFSRKSRNAYWTVWIDLNRDGTFSGDEALFSAVDSAPVSGSIDVPPSAGTGLTRMRVVMSRNNGSDPCQDVREGEIEDYAVVLLP